ncbi:KIF13A isoform 5 [Pan troglodytes]|uniref:KIF13A isoform 5 n=2 Tax=Homininae TaxID=207598 RepID=A0A2J8MT83_PANTR|nr:kinesin-like protein KIF13A isoform c [Homo sapiens]XP_009448844.1 kinesin-like protein KIF13A isoform X11 [Pan troglodytes]AAI27117.1 KIF13A protein [Homo sapiens]KAI2540965.1 kinesin family member 13A [Homo sapiens]KAI4016937.1 kinesin family member 13A [Homo sapiens]PNI62725.1 KIF13A isoform 5 [Pan troglodytes]CAC20442.1 KINESIN-13A1 [Homo sapiens]|eukprot:NP_001099037.1 kinesin-like protein KIF13A isoform c [Homo sapiens]
MSDTKVKVAVRVRPMNRRELELNTKCVVEMEGNQTVLHPPPSNTKQGERKPPKVFAFDYCFWSMDESNTTKYAGQEVVFKCLGEGILEKAFQGYNACIFAYGQTGSGKSFSMMGHAEQLGLIPRLCCALFKRISLEQNESQTFKVEVSYMEIYNEKVRDLLDPKGSRQSLKVREHKVLGPYVDGLSQLAVTSFEDIESLMSEGNKSRTVAATNMNEESSRSHAVFNIIITQTLYDLQSGNSGEKVSKVSLVDLAGSERVSKTGAAGERLKEGSNINKSLTTLGLVISSLADQAAGKGKSKFVPYRDSVLTWLLKDNLGGNSQTSMIATISPAADNYEETLSTLRYADRAKRIVNHAVVNEDPNAKVIRELREEVEKLREQLSQAEAMKAPELKEKLEESEKLIKELTVTWEEKLRKTEEIAQERQRQLESMGISLEMSGIKVGDDKCYLVNLNADPALNELLVYYLKDHTRVGADTSQDIQLFGIGIQPQHCEIDIASDGDVTLTPKENARSCVNGTLVCSTTQLWHGDRILWGNNHFFRINLPKRKRRDWLKDFEKETGPPEHDLDAASEASSEPDYNYEFAQMEVIMKTLNSNDPVQNVVQVLEKQYLEEKRSALEEQRLMYERELEQLRQQLSPDRQPQSSGPDRLAYSSQTAQQKVTQWAEERDELFRQSLAKLREQLVKANTLVREANFLAEEMSKLTDYQVTLQIPAANLSANRKRGAIVSEPAIQVRRKGKSTQVWTIEKLENKLIDMRDLYQEWKEKVPEAKRLYGKRGDPFYEAQENHNLIGVANVFLECLFCDVKLQYAVPIISQQGEVAGRLHVEVMRVTGAVPERVVEDDSSENSSESGSLEVVDSSGEIIHRVKKLTCRVKIKEATGLPLNLSNFVFCQYTFWDQCESTVAAPVVDPEVPSPQSKDAQYTVTFSHCKDYVVNVTEEFLEFISDGALAIEVWGHRCAGNGSSIWEVDSLHAKTRTLHDRWNEVTRRIEMWISILELNELGEYAAVELHQAKDVNTGGIFQLRQGHSRRVQVTVKPVQHSGTLPLMVEAILSVSIGCVTARSTKLQRGLDSYQEEDLNCVRERWSDALIKRREYLDEQIKKVSNKTEKTEDDVEREAQLVEQWVGLTEERNAVLVPAPGSGIPGAPADWIPPPGMETHIPVLFLDLNADDLSANEQLVGPHASGVNSILPKEHGSQFFYLPIIKHSDDEVSATASWDSSVHDSVHLNRVTPQNERIYLIVKTTVQLSHPAAMELVLRKRIAANIYNKQSFTQSLKRRISLKNIFYSCGVTYEIVSNIPKATEEIEDRETLALLAARSENEGTSDGETYIEKYTRGVLQVENILSLERLRQAVTVKEALSTKARHIRRSLSTPNVHNVSSSRPDLSGFDEDDKGWPENQLDMSDYSSSYQDVACYGTLPRDSPRRNKEGCTSETPHALTVSPFKAFSPQPPKFFKPLMPVKEEHKKRIALEARPLLSQEDSEEEENELEAINRKLISSQPYVPVEFADFSVYNASLENREWFSSKVDLSNSRVLEKEVSRSPTTSSITSGYFSHSASNATLSDMVVPSSDSSDQLAIQTKDADSTEHSTPSLVHDFRPSSNKELTEVEKGLVKDKIIVVPLKENSALAKGSPSSQSIPEKNSKSLCRTGSCSELDACPSKISQPARGFCPREVTVEHTTNILEDHSFTEFMGVSEGKDFDGLTDSSAGELSSRRSLPNKTGGKTVSDGLHHPSQLHSKLENDQVIIPEAAFWVLCCQ